MLDKKFIVITFIVSFFIGVILVNHWLKIPAKVENTEKYTSIWFDEMRQKYDYAVKEVKNAKHVLQFEGDWNKKTELQFKFLTAKNFCLELANEHNQQAELKKLEILPINKCE